MWNIQKKFEGSENKTEFKGVWKKVKWLFSEKKGKNDSSSCYAHPSPHVGEVGEESRWPPIFFEFHIKILKVICCISKKKFVGLEITGPYLLNHFRFDVVQEDVVQEEVEPHCRFLKTTHTRLSQKIELEMKNLLVCPSTPMSYHGKVIK